MASQHKHTPELRRFLVINFWVGTCENGYRASPALVSTHDNKWFHLWDEPSAAVLGADDYEVVKVYRLGVPYDEVMRQFAKDFAPTATGRHRSIGLIAPDGSFFSAEGWADLGQHPVPAVHRSLRMPDRSARTRVLCGLRPTRRGACSPADTRARQRRWPRPCRPQVITVLEQLIALHSAPAYIRSDNGPA
jgi:hypothetical protein